MIITVAEIKIKKRTLNGNAPRRVSICCNSVKKLHPTRQFHMRPAADESCR